MIILKGFIYSMITLAIVAIFFTSFTVIAILLYELFRRDDN